MRSDRLPSKTTVHPQVALRRLANEIRPSENEVSAAKSHFNTVRARLNKSFGLPRIIHIGSHARGSAIRTHSDVDFLVVLPKKLAYWGGRLVSPSTFLTNIASDLSDRYKTSCVRRDGQAVVIDFRGGAHAVDVVPGIFVEMLNSRPLYLIPGNDGQWIETSPETHDKLFRAADVRSGGKLGAVSRLIKAWRFGRDPAIPISSFYIDLLLATSNLASGVQSYGECVYSFFKELVDRDARGLRDPAKIAGVVTASSSPSQTQRLISSARYARDHSALALEAQARLNFPEAIRQWEIVFNINL